MRHILPLALFLAAFFVSCSDPQDPNPSFKNRGMITGQDTRKCSCCGGWFIEIEGTQYRFLELPAGSNVKLTEATFPIPVLVSWSKPTPANDCVRDVIAVHAMVYP